MSDLSNYIDKLVRGRIIQYIKTVVKDKLYSSGDKNCFHDDIHHSVISNDDDVDHICTIAARKLELALFVIGLKNHQDYTNAYGKLIYNVMHNTEITLKNCLLEKSVSCVHITVKSENACDNLNNTQTLPPNINDNASKCSSSSSNNDSGIHWCSCDSNHELTNHIINWKYSEFNSKSQSICERNNLQYVEKDREEIIRVLTRDEILISNIESGCTDSASVIRCHKCKSYDIDVQLVQTRSPDEPSTIFCTCQNPNCRTTWKARS